MKTVIKILALTLALVFALSFVACSTEPATDAPATDAPAAEGDAAESSEPIEISFSFSDNATLPFTEEWPILLEIQEKNNVIMNFEPIPIADYSTRVSLMLNTGENTTDVVLGQSTKGENASLALNGALVPISDYSDWTPNFNAFVEENGLQDDIDMIKLQDGKYYYLPAMYDVPFYDGGLILRDDFLAAEGFEDPKTFDDLYEILSAYKAQNPDSYPLTILAGPRVLYRMTMPSFGLSIGINGASGSNVLSWDYENEEYFAAAISDEYKNYITMMAKWFDEGLVDPEMAEPIDGDRWSQKLAAGDSIATYAYYDQIGGVEAGSTIEGFSLQMYPPLEGTYGAHHQEKSKTGTGIMFPISTSERDDFEQVVRAVDEIFFAEDNATMWCLGVEGESYTMDGDTVVYSDDLVNSENGVYKEMQLTYGGGVDGLQLIWINAREMTKYDENYAAINEAVAAMDEAIMPLPPTPLFDDLQAEEAGILQSPLADTWERWNNDFFTGAKSVEADWDEYVQEMTDKGILDFTELYNANLA